MQPAISPKPEFTLDLTEEVLEIVIYLQEISFVETSFLQKCRLHHKDFLPLFKMSENFLRSITFILFTQEVVTLLMMTCLEYTVNRTNF